jgi:CBS domain-containing protein
MRLKEILQAKGSQVHTITPDLTLDDVVHALVRHNVGSLVVCEPHDPHEVHPHVLGIITERDILRAHDAHQAPLDQLRVAGSMSAQPVVACPDDTIEHAMKLMTQHRVRHLPIVVDGRLYGMISIGDVVKTQHDALELENYCMLSYIRSAGAARTVGGDAG